MGLRVRLGLFLLVDPPDLVRDGRQAGGGLGQHPERLVGQVGLGGRELADGGGVDQPELLVQVLAPDDRHDLARSRER